MKPGAPSCGPLVEFSFVSMVADGIPDDAVLRIAQAAWSFNRRMRITGLLQFDQGRFRELIEGEAPVLLALAARILTDPRHQAIAVRSLRAIRARRYGSWRAEGLDQLCGAPLPPATGLTQIPRPAAKAPAPAPAAGAGLR